MPKDLPDIKQEYFPLKGGLDQMTPAISLEAGKLFDAMNYEIEISGGYRRIDGYERYDGRPAPTSAMYWSLTITQTGGIFAGQTVTGLTSGATARVLGLFSGTLVLGRLTGAFVNAEAIQIAGATVATATSPSGQANAVSASDDADYNLLAANDYRADILVVPGSGRIRGVWPYNDVVYAFRDSVDGLSGNMYKASAGGWVQIAFSTELPFSSATGGTTPITAGQTIQNAAASPTKTATVLAVVTRKGTWGTDAVGSLIITPTLGSFANTDPIFVGATQKASATATAAAITRLPGGSMEFDNANFTGSTATFRMYGVDGINPAFEFDGTTYVPIRTGMTADTPQHIKTHRFYLFLSFLGSVQFSGLGAPYSYSVVLGAGEIGLSDYCTGFLQQGGNNAGSTLAIYTKRRTYMLYGSSAANFNLVASVPDVGISAFTMQPVSNNSFGLTSRGIQVMITTLTYGDFDYASVSHLVNRYMSEKRGLETASLTLRSKNQYRLFFSDGYGLMVGLTGDTVDGLIPLNYGKPVRCAISYTTLATGIEVSYFGSDDGYVYQDGVGTSFDGAPINAWIRPAFNHSKSPRIRKRYRRAIFEVKPEGFCKLNIGYDIGYANPDVLPPETITNTQVNVGGFWDQFTWDQFTWDTKVFADVSMSLTGTEKNISFLVYSNRAQDKSHTMQGITLMYTPQRAER